MTKRIFLLCIGLLLCLTGCERAPLKIGLLAPLTGKFADIGIGIRQGAQIAVEEINEKGGINGRKVLLVSENAFDTHLSGKVVPDHLYNNKDVVSVIGPALSQTTAQLKPHIDAYKGIFISPTVSSDQFTGLKDNLFRVNSTTADRARILANYVSTQTPFRRVTVIGDLANAAYVNSFNHVFMDVFQRNDGTIVEEIHINSTRNPEWTNLVDSFDPSTTDAILINSSAINVAEFVRKLRVAKVDTPLLSTSWGFNRELLVAAGRDIDGTIFISTYDPTSTFPPYLAFQEKHHKRFGGGGMGYFTVYGYEAAHILFRALKKTGGKRKGLHDALTDGEIFKGLYGNFALDEFGDVQRENFMMTIKDGKFVKLSWEK